MNRLLLYVHFNKFGTVNDHVIFQLQKMRPLFSKVIVLSNSIVSQEDRERLQEKNLFDELIQRTNTGFDFAAWHWKPSNADTLGSPYSVTFTVNDGTGLEDTGTVEITVEPFFVPPSGLEGDLNGDHKVDIADIVYFVNFLFKDGPPPNPLAAGDINGDCFVTLSDLIYLVNFIYNNGPFPTFRCF